VRIVWTPEKIENYKRASEYTSFHKKLSVLVEPYLDERWTLADIGAGPGLIDIWLAPMAASIDVIDKDSAAIDDLRARLEDPSPESRRLAEKIRPRAASLEELAGESWDVVMMGFFGIDKDVIEAVLPLARRRLLIFMHGRPDQAGPLAAEDNKDKFSAADMEAFLKEKEIVYKKSEIEMQFGQPFKTIRDIQQFLAGYGGMDDEAAKRIADAEERIIKTKRFDYPYYLPKSISVALFIILIR